MSTNPYLERARQAARATDDEVNLEQGLTGLLHKAVPAARDRRSLQDLIDQVQQASDSNRRNAALASGLVRNGEVVFSILQKLARWL